MSRSSGDRALRAQRDGPNNLPDLVLDLILAYLTPLLQNDPRKPSLTNSMLALRLVSRAWDRTVRRANAIWRHAFRDSLSVVAERLDLSHFDVFVLNKAWSIGLGRLDRVFTERSDVEPSCRANVHGMRWRVCAAVEDGVGSFCGGRVSVIGTAKSALPIVLLSPSPNEPQLPFYILGASQPSPVPFYLNPQNGVSRWTIFESLRSDYVLVAGLSASNIPTELHLLCLTEPSTLSPLPFPPTPTYVPQDLRDALRNPSPLTTHLIPDRTPVLARTHALASRVLNDPPQNLVPTRELLELHDAFETAYLCGDRMVSVHAVPGRTRFVHLRMLKGWRVSADGVEFVWRREREDLDSLTPCAVSEGYFAHVNGLESDRATAGSGGVVTIAVLDIGSGNLFRNVYVTTGGGADVGVKWIGLTPVDQLLVLRSDNVLHVRDLYDLERLGSIDLDALVCGIGFDPRGVLRPPRTGMTLQGSRTNLVLQNARRKDGGGGGDGLLLVVDLVRQAGSAVFRCGFGGEGEDDDEEARVVEEMERELEAEMERELALLKREFGAECAEARALQEELRSHRAARDQDGDPNQPTLCDGGEGVWIQYEDMDDNGGVLGWRVSHIQFSTLR
ncbi:hypothetical protein BJ742DRAFT_741882 [Cladochytrium replicatum]|nr:hypothetical protein BJ742DRAFT_741882 [Cladochytrium replicatum]